jgi:hypothetical protein
MFVDRAQAAIPATAPAAGLPLMALIDRYHAALSREGVHGLMADRLWDGPEASRVLDRALQEWTPAGQLRHAAALSDLNLLAYALTAARDPARAATVFGAVAGVATPTPGHDPVLTFTHASGEPTRHDDRPARPAWTRPQPRPSHRLPSPLDPWWVGGWGR